MASLLRHKGYEGTAEMDIERGVCHGRILHIEDLVTYEASAPKRLHAEFVAAVDGYLRTCKELGRPAKRPYGGVFNVRTSAEKHAALAVKAARDKRSLNAVVNEAFDAYLAKGDGRQPSDEPPQVRVAAVLDNLVVIDASHAARGDVAPTVLAGDVVTTASGAKSLH